MALSYKQVLELIFPPTADLELLRSAPPELFTRPRLYRNKFGYHLLPYREPAVRAAVHLAKFHHNEEALLVLATALTHCLQTLSVSDPLIIPVPLSRTRERTRGYNQVTEVLKTVARQEKLNYTTHVLKRVSDRAPQSGLDRSARLANMHDVYRTTSRAANIVRNRHVILLDDVLTTGATMTAARASLAPLSTTSLTCLTLAH